MSGKTSWVPWTSTLLIKLSVPMMVSMLVQALYNVVDSIFVSHVSESA